MPNTYFQFKQFIVHQHRTAMKVCTDACLFGAFVAKEIQDEKCKIENVLDIGSGTGLLSLMLAQKTPAKIDAVEIDEEAYRQARQNFEISPWPSKLNIHHSSIQHFNKSTDQQFSIIISNPPFFEQSLQSTDNRKNLAKHANELPFEELIGIILMKLREDGKFFILLPYHEFQKFNSIALSQKLYLKQQVNVNQTENHSSFRTIGAFTKIQSNNINSTSIYIKDHNDYSAEFIELLKDYYLYF